MMPSTIYPRDASEKVLFDSKVMRRTLSWQSGRRVPVDWDAPPDAAAFPVSQGVSCVRTGTHCLVQLDLAWGSADDVHVAIREGELVAWQPGSQEAPMKGVRVTLAGPVVADGMTATLSYGVLTVRLPVPSFS